MKKMIKPIVFAVLLIAFLVLLMLPVQVHTSGVYPGIWATGGKYGLTCWCLLIFDYNCTCAILN